MFLVFAGGYYYPCGGFNDFIGKVKSCDDVKELIKNNSWNEYETYPHSSYEDAPEWFHIIDVLTLKLIYSGEVKIGDQLDKDSLELVISSKDLMENLKKSFEKIGK
jgi:hypothetical protein